MTDRHSETLSAFCDGEAVDPRTLADALEHADGRALLVEFARLREALRQDHEPLPAALASPRGPSRVLAARVPLPAAVALAIVAVLASLALPWPDDDLSPRPPTPTQTLRFEPGVDWHTP